MTQKQKKLIIALAVFASANAVVPAANAMHIMEGYLPATFCVAWGILCLPFLFAGFFSIQRTLRENRRGITLLAMSGVKERRVLMRRQAIRPPPTTSVFFPEISTNNGKYDLSMSF